MREIKFRYMLQHDETGRITWQIFTLEDISSRLYLDMPGRFAQYEIFAKDQYTGLRDKDGAEIYEGDIARFMGLRDPYAVIEFQKGSFGYMCWPGRRLQSFCTFSGVCGGFKSEDWEVIGNIHENPELLKPNAATKGVVLGHISSLVKIKEMKDEK